MVNTGGSVINPIILFLFLGSIAYVPQQAWMQNTTLQNNILFGKPYNSELYERVGK